MKIFTPKTLYYCIRMQMTMTNKNVCNKKNIAMHVPKYIKLSNIRMVGYVMGFRSLACLLAVFSFEKTHSRLRTAPVAINNIELKVVSPFPNSFGETPNFRPIKSNTDRHLPCCCCSSPFISRLGQENYVARVWSGLDFKTNDRD